MRGQLVCRLHGGKSRGARENAEKRIADSAAEALAAQLWVSLDTVSPVQDPVDRLARMAGGLEQTADYLAEQISKMKSVEVGEDLSRLRAQVALWERVLSQLRQALDSLARLGIADRHVRLEEARSSAVAAALTEALEEVPAELRGAVLDRFLSGLRSRLTLPAGSVVVGEVEG